MVVVGPYLGSLFEDDLDGVEEIEIGVQAARIGPRDGRFPVAVGALVDEGLGQAGHMLCEALRTAVRSR